MNIYNFKTGFDLPIGATEPVSGAGEWPPTPSLTCLYLHRDHVTWTGPDNDITSLTFANGMTMNVVGTGDPVSIEPDGLRFRMGKYLEFDLGQELIYSAIGCFAHITRLPVPDGFSSRTKQQVIGINSPNIPFLFSIDAGANQFYMDFGSTGKGGGGTRDEIGRQADTKSFTFGLEHETLPEHRPVYGATSVWLNGRVNEAFDDVSEAPKATSWVVGKDFVGTIHEGVTYYRFQGVSGPLFPESASAPWIMEQLSAS